jgi:hypothetical protein
MSGIENLDWELVDPELHSFISNLLDTNETLAEFMTVAADQLRGGENPYRIAHYLERNAASIRDSRARIMELIGGALVPNDKPVTNALREYLGRPTTPDEQRRSAQQDPRGERDR